MTEERRFGDTSSTPHESSDELRRTSWALSERIKELDCLYGISHIVEHSGGSLEYILQETVELLPRSWAFPEIACARIAMRNDEYTCHKYTPSRWVQRAPISVHGEHVGNVEVLYSEERLECVEKPFTTEERRLLDAVAERLGHIVERLDAEQLLRVGEHELRSRLTHLARVSTMGEMATNIAHEVNQPLTAIGTYAQACVRMMQAGTIDNQEVLDTLERIAGEAQRAGAIVHRLRDLICKHDTMRVPCDLNALVRNVEQLASVDARLHDVELRLALTPSLPVVFADGIQIQQVLLNLIRNAIDSMEGIDTAPREVVVRTLVRGDNEVEVSVCDNGCGLPDEVDNKLFEPFFTTKPHGVGVGLSISRSLIAAHHGRMWYSHNTDQGTTFFFALPIMSEVRDGTA
jgi:C4-dicarboxylate-specific signal transduction histidine kinase